MIKDYEMDLAESGAALLLFGSGGAFPATLEEAAYTLVGLKSPHRDSVFDNDKAIKFAEIGGQLVYEALMGAIANGNLKSIDVASLCTWAESRGDLSDFINIIIMEQMQAIRSGRKPRSGKIYIAVAATIQMLAREAK